MSNHATISPSEAADRLAIRELIEAYTHCADRRDARGQMSLFTADIHFVVYMNAKNPTPSQELHSREALAPVFSKLNKYGADALGRTEHDLHADRRSSHRGSLLLGASRQARRWKATLDSCLAPISRYFREGEWCVAVCGASAVRRLVRGAHTFMTAANQIVSMIALAASRGRA
jgi:SnoaL-like domain